MIVVVMTATVVVVPIVRAMLLTAAIVVASVVEGRRQNRTGEGRGASDKRDQKSSECRTFHDDLLPEGRYAVNQWGGTF